MSRLRHVAAAVRRLKTDADDRIIAECIRLELAEARARDDTADEAERRINDMLSNELFASVTELQGMRSIEPLRITEELNFDRWSVTIKDVIGEPFTLTQDS